MKIVDCFIFYNELDMLLFRLYETCSFVDYWVLVESTKTFNGSPKPLFYDLNKNKKEFQMFQDRIVHIILNPDEEIVPQYDLMTDVHKYRTLNPSVWHAEIFQRNSMERGIRKLLDEAKISLLDIAIFSDVDEIPAKSCFERNEDVITNWADINWVLHLDFYYYTFHHKHSTVWFTARVCRIDTFYRNGQSINDVRDRPNNYLHLRNGGWHFSYFGSPDYIRNKIENFSHQEYNQEEYKNAANIEKMIASGADLFHRKKEDVNMQIIKSIDPVKRSRLPTFAYMLIPNSFAFPWVFDATVHSILDSTSSTTTSSTSMMLDLVATFGTKNIFIDVTEKFRNTFVNKKEEAITSSTVSDMIIFLSPNGNILRECFGDPAVGYPKKLKVYTPKLDYPDSNFDIHSLNQKKQLFWPIVKTSKAHVVMAESDPFRFVTNTSVEVYNPKKLQTIYYDNQLPFLIRKKHKKQFFQDAEFLKNPLLADFLTTKQIPNNNSIQRILILQCGYGFSSYLLAKLFPTAKIFLSDPRNIWFCSQQLIRWKERFPEFKNQLFLALADDFDYDLVFSFETEKEEATNVNASIQYLMNLKCQYILKNCSCKYYIRICTKEMKEEEEKEAAVYFPFHETLKLENKMVHCYFHQENNSHCNFNCNEKIIWIPPKRIAFDLKDFEFAQRNQNHLGNISFILINTTSAAAAEEKVNEETMALLERYFPDRVYLFQSESQKKEIIEQHQLILFSGNNYIA
jgi:beta-1,4-mannosyl-glycoprotein beta-1,4-N-acetylglucosaminyltransferase